MQKENNIITIVMIVEKIELDLLNTIGKYQSLLDVDFIINVTNATHKIHTKIKIIENSFNKNFSILRNNILDQIHTEWVLFLDGDEVLSDELIDRIPTLIQNKEIEGYWISRRTYISPTKYLRYGLFYPDYQMRLFRNKEDYRFKGAVHEQLTIPFEKTTKVDADILHFPQHPKYSKLADFKNLLPYMNIQSNELVSTYISLYANKLPGKIRASITLLIKAVTSFCLLFFGGFIRGKGFLDGIDGLRAHLFLALSISGAHIMAAKKILTYESI